MLYDQSNPIKALRAWKGTVLPAVLNARDTYFYLGLHVLFYVIYQRNLTIDPETGEVEQSILPVLDMKVTGVCSGLLTFFIVFYNGHCYQRYLGLYEHCCGVGGKLMEVSGLCAVHFKTEQQQAKWNIIRYLLASIIISYGTGDDGGMDTEEWESLQARKLLTINEIKAVQFFKGFQPWLLQVWALKSAKQGFLQKALIDRQAAEAAATKTALPVDKKGRLEITRLADVPDGPLPAAYNDMEKLVVKLREHMSYVSNARLNPIPFPYFHLVNLMMMINFLMLAYALTAFNSIMTIPVFFGVVLMLNGVREVSICFASPFFDEEVGFDVNAFIKGGITNAVSMMYDLFDPNEELAPAPMPPGYTG